MLFKIGVLIYGYFAGALIQAGYWMGKFNKIDIVYGCAAVVRTC